MKSKLHERLIEKIDEVIGESPWMSPEILSRLAERRAQQNASLKARRVHLMQLADSFNAALSHQMTCREGCAHCCHMPTMIYEHEADQLAESSGRPRVSLAARPRSAALDFAQKFYGKPCPFLRDNRCSVYEVRPLICRLHHSFNDDPDDCSVSGPLDKRQPIASYNVDLIEQPYHALMLETRHQESWASIHEFFPRE